MKLFYGCTIALSAFLLFSIEPLITRALLPQLGGSSAVWITALAFFQIVLLCGYAYSLWVTPASRTRFARGGAHLALLGAAAIALLTLHPVQPGALTHLPPQLRVFALLGRGVGLPFLVLCTTAPLLQSWYARRERREVPYGLFALSNLASLTALLLYPLVFERFFSQGPLFAAWKGGFLLYVVLTVFLTLRMRSAEPVQPTLGHTESTPPGQAGPVPLPGRTRALWFLLPALASLQLAAVTEHLTQDLASLPLLWVLPLAVYLLSFVLAFELPRVYHRTVVLRLLAVLLLALGYFLTESGFNVPIGINAVFFSLELLFACWFCHAELFRLRPRESIGTAVFYLYLAAGGAVGTLLVALLGPLLTDSNFDLPATFALTALLVLFVLWREGWSQRLFWAATSLAGVALLFVLHATYARDALFQARNFYGVVRVKESQYPPQAYLSRTLYNGAIEHGMQWFSTPFRDAPLTYYTPDSGIGLALDHCCGSRPRRIGVIGLGTGTLAAYGHPGDQIRFYEINPLVVDITAHLFTFTRDTPATVQVVPGDARLSLAAEPPQRFDVLVIDAFSGDSIPVHLLTREALELYRHHLAPGGILAFHISNQYLDLAPVLARLSQASAGSAGPLLVAREVDSGPDREHGEARASWVLLTSREDFFAQPSLAAQAHPLHTLDTVDLWTDAHSSLLPILHWTGRY